ncbi:NAD-dependent epimerase/dehydratase family protein [Pseudooceanicola sp.]|uniref:NAD-dependent epimerase/dehydratase family protein n=1 Tax=Pseudooceanicola sp. TaxID=1914328 RepID=UPI0035C74899
MRVLITGAGGFLGRRLTRELMSREGIVGPSGKVEPITHLTLADLGPVPLPEAPGVEIEVIQGDLADASTLERLCARPYDSLFHLASQLTFHAEQDPDHAWAVNVDPLRALIAAAQGCPRVIFASSIAVFGGDFPAEVADDLAPLPETTYGTHKAVNELILADASRHGRIDGRALRLPIILIRPGVTQPVVSDKVAAIVREPLEGRDFAAPLPPEAVVPVASAGAVVRGFLNLHDLPPDRLPPKRTLNLPALSVTVAHMVAAAARAGATGRVTSAPDPATQAVVAGWPQHFISHHAGPLGIAPDRDFDAIIADYLAHREV